MNTAVKGEKSLSQTRYIQNGVQNGRIHYMDNLRALAMLLGIFFHASLAYSPLMHNLWLTADSQQSNLIDAGAWFSHLFRMPVFFLISGFFTCYLIEKKGIRGLMKNRALRILFPFLIFLPLVILATAATVGWAMQAVNNQSPMLSVITSFSKMPDAHPAPVKTMHLWFLYQLMFFILLVVAMYKSVGVKWLHRTMDKAPLPFLLGFPLLLVPALLTQPIPHPAPESFSPQLWSFGFYGLFFLFGFALFKNTKFLDRMQPFWLYFLVVGIALYFVLFPMLPKAISMGSVMVSDTLPAITMAQSLGAVLESYIAFFMTLGVLLISRKHFNHNSPLIQYIADSSYWIYLIHLPLLFFIQFLLLDVSWNMWLKFAFSSLGTLAIGMVTYMLLVRWTVIGRLLNGKAKSIFSLALVAALLSMSTGCSIGLTRNNYYGETYQSGTDAQKKDMKAKYDTETEPDGVKH